MSDKYDNMYDGLEAPASHVSLITPSDTTDLTQSLRGIAFSAAGTLKVKTQDGTVVTIPSGTLAPGIIHPIRIKRVYATGTTVTNIIGVY